ncbi:MAG TPA: PilZ domain-containing protein [Syntrophorhabdales bacterium]|nr:PilZ domain-containing protein [Syntrophorhabdales bacterium]
MGSEKRDFPRMLAEWRASLVFGNREISTNLRNISKGGAYLRVKDEDAHKIASTDVGQLCSLRMEQANESVSQRGQISRYVVESGSTYVAVAFARRPKALS